jgi:hypothetical protein
LSTAVAPTTPTQPASQSGHVVRDAAVSETPTTAVVPASAEEQATAAAPKTPSPAPAIGFTLHFDPDMGRFILQAREPGSGFVIFQVPQKYAVKQLSASASGTPTRGKSVDSAV